KYSCPMNSQLQIKERNELASTPARTSVLQRKCACGSHTIAGGECEECGKQKVQRHAVGPSEPAEVPPIVHEALRSPGHPLDPATRAFMEPRFGHDFSQVWVRANAETAESVPIFNPLPSAVRNYVPGLSSLEPMRIAHWLGAPSTPFALV